MNVRLMLLKKNPQTDFVIWLHRLRCASGTVYVSDYDPNEIGFPGKWDEIIIDHDNWYYVVDNSKVPYKPTETRFEGAITRWCHGGHDVWTIIGERAWLKV